VFEDPKKNDECKACPLNATSCELVDGKVKIKTCKDSYFASRSAENPDECKKCPDDAVLCEEVGGRVEIKSCIAHKYPFTPVEASISDICKECPKNSTKCNFNKVEGRVDVEDCFLGFYKLESKKGVDDQCDPCPKNSKECKFDPVLKKVAIETCDKLYYVESEDSKDDSCVSCPENGCNVCVSKTECRVDDGCKEGFSLNTEKRICVKCSEKCSECETSEKCTKC